MEEKCCYENFPLSTVILANLVKLSIYAIGSYIILLYSYIWTGVYILFLAALELRLMTKSCVNCYYYGKICFSGTGRLASMLFKKGDPGKFLKDEITPADILPDILVTLIPGVMAVICLVKDFNMPLLLLLAAMFALAFWGNGFIRSSLACKNCRQKYLGCPAEKMFSKKSGSAPTSSGK